MMAADTANMMLAAALAYAARGWHVIPVIPGDKRPTLPDWVEQSTVDHDLIVMWWTANPDHGVGIVTGQKSGIWVIDVDSYNGGDDTLADLTAQYGPIPDTIETITGGGGRHIILKWPGFNPGTSSGRLGPGLDIRADGGFIVAPPSLHRSGARYMWELNSDPNDGLAAADTPGWLAELVRPDPPRLDPPPQPRGADHTGLPDWPTLLTRSGATYAGTRRNRQTGRDYQLWTRPGKPADEGTSATLGYTPADNLHVFTTGWAPYASGEHVTRFHYYATLEHGGDHERARRALDQAEQAAALATLPTTIPADTRADRPDPFVDFRELLTGELPDTDWLIPPIFAKGRGHALYAPAKEGKSTLCLALACAAATGHQLGDDPQPPCHVLYIDYEMTETDLRQRIEELGYTTDDADTLTEYLHYLLHPGMILDTPDGATELVAMAVRAGAQIVIIDTFGRAVQGEENSADVTRAFYRLAGSPLKAAGIAWVRTDHAGKDLDRGMRGSSAKNDDVDVVWKLRRTADGVALHRTHTRINWVPETVTLASVDGARWHVTGLPPDHPDTNRAALLLARYEVPTEWGIGKVYNAYQTQIDDAHLSRESIRCALRRRKRAADDILKPTTERANDDSG